MTQATMRERNDGSGNHGSRMTHGMDGTNGTNGSDAADAVADILRGLGTIAPARDTDLIATGLLDSFGVIELLLALEARFDVRIPMEELELSQIRSIDAIAAYVTSLVPS